MISSSEVVLEGTPIARGIGIGPLYLLAAQPMGTLYPKMYLQNQGGEIERYREAITAARLEVQELQELLKNEQAFEAIGILETHLELLRDPILTSHIEAEIHRTGANGLSVLQTILQSYEKKFEMLDDPFFQERFRDIQDVADRVMKHLGTKVRHRLEHLPKGIVLFANDLTPSEVASIAVGSIAAIVTERGGATSHTAIIAKAKGIPYVSHLSIESKNLREGMSAIVDGIKGTVIISPHQETLSAYALEIEKLKKEQKSLSAVLPPPKTMDGEAISISLNIDTIDDLPDTLSLPSPCGLFRTEFLLSEEGSLPTEEEQFEIYKEILERFRGKPVVIRAFDLGGDKGAIVKAHLAEENPALGLRAIRLLLKEDSIFKKQIRALLRASAYGKLYFLIPMVTSIEELEQTKELISALQTELSQEGIDTAGFAGIGCMLEVPSAALIIDALAKECDFFSIGTNDLLQFLLAVDRNHSHIVKGATPFHPAMIRLLHTIVKEANKASIPISICGEIASDPKIIPLLLGLGIRELSVSWNCLHHVRELIANIDIRKANVLVNHSLTLSSTAAIESLWSIGCANGAPPLNHLS